MKSEKDKKKRELIELISSVDINDHVWIDYDNHKVCAKCGVVQRKDGLNKECKGKTKIALRDF